ncbi:cilia- and flagella-associated protein 57-like [Synchiropus picturatus]
MESECTECSFKELDESYNQKLLTEHERYEKLQHKYKRMQDDYEAQLRAADDNKSQSLEAQRLIYEAKLQEANQLLEHWQSYSEQGKCEFEEHMRQAEEDADRGLYDVQTMYNKKLQREQESNTRLMKETSIMKQQIYHLQRQIQDKCMENAQLRQEQQKLQGLIRNLDCDIATLKKKILEYERTKPDQERVISELKKKNHELEKMTYNLDSQLNELKKQAGPAPEIFTEKERIQQLEDELVQMEKSNVYLKLNIDDLQLKLKTRDQEMDREKQKLKQVRIHLERLKSDLYHCGGFIQEPKKLKDSVKHIVAQYVHHGDELVNSELEDLQRAFRRQSEHLEKTVACLKARLAKCDEEHEKKQVKLMKANVTLVNQINELRRDLLKNRTELKNCKIQLDMVKDKKPRVQTEKGT